MLLPGRDDAKVNIWAVGRDRPECVLTGHQSDVKCVEWHGFRSLIATGSRDSTVRLWDPRLGGCVRWVCTTDSVCSLISRPAYLLPSLLARSTISGHKKQVNCCQWNGGGNLLATGSMDGLVKLFDIRTMREVEVWRGQNSEVRSRHIFLHGCTFP